MLQQSVIILSALQNKNVNVLVCVTQILVQKKYVLFND